MISRAFTSIIVSPNTHSAFRWSSNEQPQWNQREPDYFMICRMRITAVKRVVIRTVQSPVSPEAPYSLQLASLSRSPLTRSVD